MRPRGERRRDPAHADTRMHFFKGLLPSLLSGTRDDGGHVLQSHGAVALLTSVDLLLSH